MNNKAISPLMATTLLVAFTLVVAAIAGIWLTYMSRQRALSLNECIYDVTVGNTTHIYNERLIVSDKEFTERTIEKAGCELKILSTGWNRNGICKEIYLTFRRFNKTKSDYFGIYNFSEKLAVNKQIEECNFKITLVDYYDWYNR